MATFNIRVELHYANASDYQRLAEAMSAKGFKGYVVATTNRIYELPPGEYAYEGYQSNDDVRALAADAAAKTGKSFAVRSTEGSTCWLGLKEISSAAKSYGALY